MKPRGSRETSPAEYLCSYLKVIVLLYFTVQVGNVFPIHHGKNRHVEWVFDANYTATHVIVQFTDYVCMCMHAKMAMYNK